jgi:hypothetical protein
METPSFLKRKDIMRKIFIMACAALLCAATAQANPLVKVNPKDRYSRPPGIVIPQDNSPDSIELRRAIEADASDRGMKSPDTGKKLDATTRPPQNRQYFDMVDATDRVKIHFIYAVPAGGFDRGFDLTNAIPYLSSSANRWLAAQTKKKFLLDTYEDHLDITFVSLPNSEDYYQSYGSGKHSAIVEELRSIGHIQQNKIYVVYYEGWHSYACADAEPRGPTTVVYMWACGIDSSSVAQSPTADPDYHEFVFLHEVVHNTVGISPEAPNSAGGYHVTDSPEDLMYAGDQVWRPAILDYNNDDYYNRKSLPDPIVNLKDSTLLTR